MDDILEPYLDYLANKYSRTIILDLFSKDDKDLAVEILTGLQGLSLGFECGRQSQYCKQPSAQNADQSMNYA